MNIKSSESPRIITLILEMTEQEAEALMVIAGSVSGSSDGPRGSISEIYYALKVLGVRYKDSTYVEDDRTLVMCDKWPTP